MAEGKEEAPKVEILPAIPVAKDDPYAEKWVSEIRFLGEVKRPVGPFYPIDRLRSGADFPQGVDGNARERYLSDEDFQETFGMNKAAFAALPKWKRDAKKKAHHLF